MSDMVLTRPADVGTIKREVECNDYETLKIFCDAKLDFNHEKFIERVQAHCYEFRGSKVTSDKNGKLIALSFSK